MTNKNSTSNNFILFISCISLVAINQFLVFKKINENVRNPYMDEIFHIPQAQAYCDGNYTQWNDKITTLPGLYILSAIPLRFTSLILKLDINEWCSAISLRYFNLLLIAPIFWILFKIFNQIHNKNEQFDLKVQLLNAFAIFLFPLNYFFHFLYYTDVGSTLFCLMTYYCHLKSRHLLASLLGLIAICFRQTNVIWILFLLALTVLNSINRFMVKKAKKNDDKLSLEDTDIDFNKVKVSNFFVFLVSRPLETKLQLGKSLKYLSEDIFGKKETNLINNLFNILINNFSSFISYILVLLSFAIFVYVNNGIVVGDRSNHEASTHLCQIFYFWSFTCLFSFSHQLKSIKKVVLKVHSFKKYLISLTLIFFFCLVVSKFTYEHKFLLSDNRHYTFYIWSRIFKRHFSIKYVLTIFYTIAMFVFYRTLVDAKKSIGWLIIFSACFIVCLVPQKLLEFRYFIVPYLIYRLNIKSYCIRNLILEIMFNVAINSFTIYLFLNKTFYWPSSNDIQRFMW